MAKSSPICYYSSSANQWYCGDQSTQIRGLNIENKYNIILHTNQRQSIKRWIGFLFLFLFLNQLLISIIHETGHAIFAVLFDVKIVNIMFFPLIWYIGNFEAGGMIWFDTFDYIALSDWQDALFCMGGSLFSLICGFIVFGIIVFNQFDTSFEYWGLLFFVMCALEIITYSIVDMFEYWFGQVGMYTGDWLTVYELYHWMVYVMIGFDIGLLIFTIYLIKKTLFRQILI